jgi:hypothetical protein
MPDSLPQPSHGRRCINHTSYTVQKKTGLRLFESSYHLTTLFHVQRLYDHIIISCGKMDERPAEGTVVIQARKTKNSEVRQLVAFPRLG